MDTDKRRIDVMRNKNEFMGDKTGKGLVLIKRNVYLLAYGRKL